MDRFYKNVYIRYAVRIILGGLFIYASLDKIAYPSEFAKIIYYYRILPAGWENILAIFLPWMELIIGLMLVINKWVRGSLLLYNLLLVIFIIALLQAQVRGLDIACGCFSVDPSSTSEVWLRIISDLVMLFFGVTLWMYENNEKEKELESLEFQRSN